MIIESWPRPQISAQACLLCPSNPPCLPSVMELFPLGRMRRARPSRAPNKRLTSVCLGPMGPLTRPPVHCQGLPAGSVCAQLPAVSVFPWTLQVPLQRLNPALSLTILCFKFRTKVRTEVRGIHHQLLLQILRQPLPTQSTPYFKLGRYASAGGLTCAAGATIRGYLLHRPLRLPLFRSDRHPHLLLLPLSLCSDWHPHFLLQVHPYVSTEPSGRTFCSCLFSLQFTTSPLSEGQWPWATTTHFQKLQQNNSQQKT